MKQVNRKRLNLEVRQDDPQQSVAHGIGTLVVEHPGCANTFRCSPHGRLGRGDGEARVDRHVGGRSAWCGNASMQRRSEQFWHSCPVLAARRDSVWLQSYFPISPELTSGLVG